MISFILTIALLCVGALCYARFIEPSMLQRTNTEISTENLALQDGDALKICLFGDTHFGFSYTTEDFRKVISAVNDEEPDLIVFTGDLIDDINIYDGDLGELSAALGELRAPLGKFAVYGNHDYGSNGQTVYRQIMEDAGFTLLVNEYAYIADCNLVLFGIDDCLIGYGEPSLLAAASPDTCNIAICHEPDIADELTDYNVSLMLSGHTHGGQVRLPVYTEKFLPPYGEKYIRGLYEIEDAGFPLYVTRGLGTTSLPLRFMARPELSVIILR